MTEIQREEFKTYQVGGYVLSPAGVTAVLLLNSQKEIVIIMTEEAKEKCAVLGIYSKRNVFDDMFDGLYSLQHRGQESAGIATYNNGQINLHKAMGLVCDVFKGVNLEGNSGIGHVRYSTTGASILENAQPLVINYSKGSFAIVHNGNIVNSGELKSLLEKRGSVFSTTTDTEIIAQLIAHEHIKTDNFIEGIKNAMNLLNGAYCLTILHNEDIIAVRDPWGLRPLILGKSEGGYAVASESCALDTLDMKTIRDIKPSEILVINRNLESYTGRKEKTSHCIFEYVYFARPDSVIDGKSVYEVRKNLGRTLAKEAPADADMVIAVPDSGITTAIGYSDVSRIKYSEGMIKNRYCGRTFILPEQGQREKSVRLKLNPIASEVNGKRMVLVDDSIVRGTTLKRLIGILRGAGASKIHVRISCPPIKYPCFYGIDMQSRKEFIASKKSIEAVRREIGADSLAYTSLEGLIKAIGMPKDKLCLACLTGDYPTKEKQTKLKI